MAISIEELQFGTFLQHDRGQLWENLEVLEERVDNLLGSFHILCRFRASPITTMCRLCAVELVEGTLITFDEALERSPVFRLDTDNSCLAS